MGAQNIGLGLNNAQLLQNRLYNDYGDYGGAHGVYPDYGVAPVHHGYGHFGHYCQEDQIHIGLLITTIAVKIQQSDHEIYYCLIVK